MISQVLHLTFLRVGAVRLGLALFATVALNGCAGTPQHSVNVSRQLRERPVKSIYIFTPGFPEKVKRLKSIDLPEMKPENHPESAKRIITALSEVLSASILVESSYTPDDAAQSWASEITHHLAKGRVPLGVDSHIMPVESVMLIGAIHFGRELDQLQITIPFLPFPPWSKSWLFGKQKWEHVSDLQILLVDPRNGSVLFDVRHEARLKDPTNDPALADRMTREVGWVLVGAFFPEE